MEDYLCHHGVKGMKWGRRKAHKSSASGAKTKRSTLKNKLSKIDKEKVKSIAKTTAAVAGGAALAIVLPKVSSEAYNAISSWAAANHRAGLRKDWYNYIDMTTNKGFTYIGKGTYVRGVSSLTKTK